MSETARIDRKNKGRRTQILWKSIFYGN